LNVFLHLWSASVVDLTIITYRAARLQLTRHTWSLLTTSGEIKDRILQIYTAGLLVNLL